MEVPLKSKPVFSYTRLPSRQQYTTGAMTPVLADDTPPRGAAKTMNGAWLTRRRVPIAFTGVRLPRRHMPTNSVQAGLKRDSVVVCKCAAKY